MVLFFVILHKALTIYSFAIIAYILMSWFPGARESAIGIFLQKICEPFLEPFRKIIPPIGMIDISPLVAMLVLSFANNYGVPALYDMLRGF